MMKWVTLGLAAAAFWLQPANAGTIFNDFGPGNAYHSSGWTVGGGFDYAITGASLMPGWSVRVEYLYVKIPSYTTFTPGTGPGLTQFGRALTYLSTSMTDNIVRVGFAYKFGNYTAPAVYK